MHYKIQVETRSGHYSFVGMKSIEDDECICFTNQDMKTSYRFFKKQLVYIIYQDIE